MAAEDDKYLTSVLRFDPPETKPIDFESVLRNVSDTTQNSLRAISDARRNMTHAGSKLPPAAAINHISHYLPCLLGVKAAVDDCGEELKTNLRVCWKSAVGTRYETRFYEASKWQYEVVMTLLTYALLERNAAADLLREADESARFEEKFSVVAKRLCAAAGLLEHIERHQVHEWIADRSVPERMSGTYQALRLISLAEAQQLAVRRAALKQVSRSLLAKLCADVHTRLVSASLLLQAVAEDMRESFQPALLAYVAVNAARYRALTYLYLAEDAVSDARYGCAVTLLELALETVQPEVGTLVTHDSVAPLLRAREHEHSRMRSLLDRVRADNQAVYFQAVCDREDAAVAFPEGKSLVQATPFEPPAPTTITIDVEDRGYSCIVM